MHGDVIARGLEFPEGPVWLGGAPALHGDHGRLRVPLARGADAVERVAATGGGPNGATLGPDGALYVTQNGGMTAEGRVPAGILRVDLADGVVGVRGHGGRRASASTGPNDLAFGPDGRLWFTDPRGAADPARTTVPGRLFALDLTTGEGELFAELGPVFPNGIGFLADGTLVWTESFTRRVMAWRDGAPEVLIDLPERHAPDGFCVGADGTLYVATTFAHCVSVVRDGEIVDRLVCGDGMVTNCCFGGTDLYVTDSRRGLLWRFALGVDGLPLH